MSLLMLQMLERLRRSTEPMTKLDLIGQMPVNGTQWNRVYNSLLRARLIYTDSHGVIHRSKDAQHCVLDHGR